MLPTDQLTSPVPADVEVGSNNRAGSLGWATFAALAALLLISFGAYSSIFGGSFYCDDFAFLRFVHSAHQTGLGILWPIFATPLAEIQPFLDCYRPLPDVVFLIEYLLAGVNPFWFHLTNVCLHWVSSMLVYLIGTRLIARSQPADAKVIAFGAAALFAAYPVYAEVIYGPTNVVTQMGCLFLFASMAAFLIWQDGKKPLWYGLSLLSLVFAVLSKEMAVALPAVLTFIQWKSKERLHKLWPFWMIVALYLVLRAAVLGLGPGGYTGHLGDGLWQNFLPRLFNEWQPCFFPLHPDVFAGATMWPTFALSVLYATGAVLALLRLHTGDKIQGVLPVLSLWAALVFAVVAPAWTLEPSLAGGRHLYAIAPAIFLVISICTYSRRFRQFWLAMISLLTATFIYINHANNTAYVAASNNGSELRLALEAKAHANPSRRIVLVNAPMKYKGIYLFAQSSMLTAMMCAPVTQPDLSNRFELPWKWTNIDHDLFSLARLQELTSNPQYLTVAWDADAMRLQEVRNDFGSGDLLEEIMPSASHFNQLNQLCIQSFRHDPGLAHQTSFVEVTLGCKQTGPVPAGTVPSVSLWWQNRVLYLPVIADGMPHVYRFVVGSSMDWMFGPHDGSFEIRMPSPDFHNELSSTKLVGWKHLTPAVSLIAKGTIAYDARRIKDAATVVVEVSRPNALLENGFALRHRKYLSGTAGYRGTFKALQGQVQLPPDCMPKQGVYEIEVSTLDRTGQVGYFAEPIFVQIP